MSRPLRVISFLFLLFSLAFAGCKTSTPYTRRYSPRKSYFVTPPEKSDRTAEELIKATEVPGAPGAPVPGGPEIPPPPIPGLPAEVPPAAPVPPVDPLAPAPAAPL